MNLITQTYKEAGTTIDYVVDNISDELGLLLRKHKCIIAGGAVTSAFTQTEINDIDVYFRDKESLISLLHELDDLNEETYLSPFVIKYVSEKAVLFIDMTTNQDIQFIYQAFYDSPQAIFNNFDFTVNMGAIVLGVNDDDDLLVTDERFTTHNLQRKLVLNPATEYPIISALRVNKYKSRGYTMSGIEYLKLMMCIVKLDMNSWEDFKSQLGGVYGVQFDFLYEEDFTLEETVVKVLDDATEDEYGNLLSYCVGGTFPINEGTTFHLRNYKDLANILIVKLDNAIRTD
jgi:hypothetical protein